MDAFITTDVLFRWLHVLFGITWIGLLYYFNFVQGEYFKEAEAGAKADAVKKLAPRALWWFRWGAMITVLTGLGYIIWKNWVASDAGFTGTGGLMTSPWGQWISLGGLFGIIMWFNVWFILLRFIAPLGVFIVFINSVRPVLKAWLGAE